MNIIHTYHNLESLEGRAEMAEPFHRLGVDLREIRPSVVPVHHPSMDALIVVSTERLQQEEEKKSRIIQLRISNFLQYQHYLTLPLQYLHYPTLPYITLQYPAIPYNIYITNITLQYPTLPYNTYITNITLHYPTLL